MQNNQPSYSSSGNDKGICTIDINCYNQSERTMKAEKTILYINSKTGKGHFCYKNSETFHFQDP